MTGVTVITANGTFTVAAGQSWGSSFGPDGDVTADIHDGPFVDVTGSADGAWAPSGNPIGMFTQVEAVYLTFLVTAK